MSFIIGIDLGGTNIKGIIINENGDVLKQHYIPTHDSGDASWRTNVKEMLNYLKEYLQEPILGIGLISWAERAIPIHTPIKNKVNVFILSGYFLKRVVPFH